MTKWTSCRCGFELWVPIADLSVSTVGLYDDDRFPGRCIVAFREHHVALEDLKDDQASAFMADIRIVGRAIKEATDATRINYAVLGNTEPHLHCHVIPRQVDDPVPTRPPWEHPAKKAPLPTSRVDEICKALGIMIEGLTSG